MTLHAPKGIRPSRNSPHAGQVDDAQLSALFRALYPSEFPATVAVADSMPTKATMRFSGFLANRRTRSICGSGPGHLVRTWRSETIVAI